MYLYDDSLGHVGWEVLLHVVIPFQSLLEAAARSQFQNETQRAQHHTVQPDHVPVLQGSEDGELLLQV